MSPELRYERKFLFPGAWEAAEAAVRLHPALFGPAYPDRWVNNLYLDTPGRADLRDSLDGVSPRAKLRVRWYGERAGLVADPRLELKLRHGAVTGKEAYPLRPFRFDGGLTPGRGASGAEGARWPPADSRWPAAAELARGAELPPLAREELLRREVCLFNRYRRSYYLSADRIYRLTLDRELSAVSRDRGGLSSGADRVILELKYPPQAEEKAAAVAQGLGLRVSRFSKYVAGSGHPA